MPEPDPLAELEGQAAKNWGVGSAQYRRHLAFAARRCPDCGGPLVVSADHPTSRRCGKCKLAWFAQFSERDGSAKPTSLIAAGLTPTGRRLSRSRDRGHLETLAHRQYLTRSRVILQAAAALDALLIRLRVTGLKHASVNVSLPPLLSKIANGTTLNTWCRCEPVRYRAECVDVLLLLLHGNRQGKLLSSHRPAPSVRRDDHRLDDGHRQSVGQTAKVR